MFGLYSAKIPLGEKRGQPQHLTATVYAERDFLPVFLYVLLFSNALENRLNKVAVLLKKIYLIEHYKTQQNR